MGFSCSPTMRGWGKGAECQGNLDGANPFEWGHLDGDQTDPIVQIPQNQMSFLQKTTLCLNARRQKVPKLWNFLPVKSMDNFHM